jgi:hypothetical protein
MLPVTPVWGFTLCVLPARADTFGSGANAFS